MDSAPIDIKYSESLRWLEERFIIPKDWAKRIEVIRVKITELMDDIAKKETPEFIKINETFKNKRESMSYEDIMRLNQLLIKTEEAKVKTLFGYYSSTIMKNITLIISLYEKNNVLLCECSKLIIQYIGYEIPDLTKTVNTLEKYISDTNGKINERNSHAEKNKEKIKALFKTYEIKEVESIKEISDQIIRKLGSLPSMLDKISRLIKSDKISKVIELYELFYKTIYQEDLSNDKEFLSTLKNISKNGDYLLTTDLNQKSDDIYKIITDKVDHYIAKFSNTNLSTTEVLDNAVWNFKTLDQSEVGASKTALLDKQLFNKLTNDLNEILIFVTQRLSLLNTTEETTVLTYQLDILKVNNEINQEFLTTSKKYISEILSLINNDLLTFLLKMFDDENNILKIVNSFESLKLENISLENGNINFKKGIEEAKGEIVELNKKVQGFKKDAKVFKKLMEKKLTDHLKRKITIIGDINLIT